MKKTVLFFTALLLAFHFQIINLNAQGVFHLPNPSFEQWDGGYDSEPTHWNTFESSDGSYASLASDNHHYRRSGHRPGGSGNYYLTIYTKSIMGIKANGNMTTGRIHAGSMSASSSENYNYTQRSNSNHCQPFTGTPDSMYVWVSFYASESGSVAQVEAIIHGDNDFKAPNDMGTASMYKGRAVAQTHRTTSSASQMNWQQLKVPFVYDGSSTAAYILVNMTTNNVAGAGSKNDSLSIDDIEFIYSAWLTDIKVNGTTIDGFTKGRLGYRIHVDDIAAFDTDAVDCSTEVTDATVEKTLSTIDDTTVCVFLAVTAEDGTQRIYSINATSGQAPVAINGVVQASPRIFPNPAADFITVEAAGTLEIIDISGRTVMNRSVNHGQTIDVSGLAKGIYAVRLNGTAAGRLVIGTQNF